MDLFAGRGGGERVRVEDRPGEEGPVGQDAVDARPDEHPLAVDAVPSRARRHGLGEDERHPGHAGEGDAQVDVSQRGEAQDAFAVCRQRPRAGLRRRVAGLPREDRVGDPPPRGIRALHRHADGDIEGQQRAVVRGQSDDGGGFEPMLATASSPQPDGGAHCRRVRGRPRRQVRHLEGAVAAPHPDGGDGAGSGRPGRDLDAVGDHERREHADPELAEVVRHPQAVRIPFRGAADRREQLGGFVGGESDPAVGDHENRRSVGLGVRGEPDRCRRCGILGQPRGHGVDGVLQQLPQVDMRTRVEVVGQQVDHATQVDPEALRHQAPCAAAPERAAVGVIPRRQPQPPRGRPR